jgi:hypothetical protein
MYAYDRIDSVWCCRDGSVFTAVTLEELKQPEKLYLALGCKLAVGMPFKDIASSDTLLMRELPPADDTAGRQTLRRLREVGMHVIAPIEHLRSNPMDHVIPLVHLVDAQSFEMPPNCERCVAHNRSTTLLGTAPCEHHAGDRGCDMHMPSGHPHGANMCTFMEWHVACRVPGGPVDMGSRLFNIYVPLLINGPQ